LPSRASGNGQSGSNENLIWGLRFSKPPFN
jgi:hypothetical protein